MGICDNQNFSTSFVSGTQNARAVLKCFKNITETVFYYKFMKGNEF